MELKKLERRMDFTSLPGGWRLASVSIDWSGDPVLLFERGRPKFPAGGTHESLAAWFNTPPKSHHLLHWTGSQFSEVTFENKRGRIVISHAQPFDEGWLLAEGRGGAAEIYDRRGSHVLRTLDLGDASEEIQTTPDGRIWVSYFDEGVFGNGIGNEGLVCFDSNGHPIFKYATFANRADLPHISDCYSLNVASDAVWVCYYTDFPLVCLRNFELGGIWQDWGSTSALAIRGEVVIRFPAYRVPHLVKRTLDNDTETTWQLVTPEGKNLSTEVGERGEDGRPNRVLFNCTGRGNRFYVWTELDLYELRW